MNQRTLWCWALLLQCQGLALCIFATWLLFHPTASREMALAVDTAGVLLLYWGGRLQGRWEARGRR